MNESFASIFALTNKISRLPKNKTTFIIGIDGREGAGKSTLAESLRRGLRNTTIIPLEDFYSPELLEVDRKRVVSQVINPLKNNQPAAKYQRFDWNKNGLMEWRSVQNEGILIVEGATALHPDLLEFYDLTIWVECPAETGLKRGASRDVHGYKLSTRAEWLSIWVPKEKEYIKTHTPHKKAQFIFDNSSNLTITA